MKRVIIIILALFLLSGCGAQVQTAVSSAPKASEAPIVVTPRPTTSQGTPITDGANLPSIAMQDTPNSSCFSSIGYDSGTGTLMVVFRDSGAKYAYDEVPSSVYKALCEADSMGGYYNKNIKGHYDCTKVEK